ncbi:MAG: DsbA family protein [Xanthobacteraceae bacterium]
MDSNRRQFLIGAAAVAIIAAAGTGYYVMSRPPAQPAGSKPGAASAANPAELLKPGPLGDMALGNPKAPVTIIEYASMTCGHCATFHNTTYPELKKRYVDTGKVRFIFREFPLDQLALAAFMLARCAGDDRYFAMIETLFQQQNDWVVQQPLQPLMAIARQAGFTEQTFNECLKNQKVQDGIVAVQQRAATEFNVQSTPTFFINGELHRGAATLAEMEKQIARFL